MPNVRRTKEAHIASGTYRKDRHFDGVKPVHGIPNKHDWLVGVPGDIWHEIILQWEQVEMICYVDVHALAILCELLAEFREDPRKFTPAKIAQARMLMNDFGMTPQGRAKIPAKKESKPDNEFAEFN